MVFTVSSRKMGTNSILNRPRIKTYGQYYRQCETMRHDAQAVSEQDTCWSYEPETYHVLPFSIATSLTFILSPSLALPLLPPHYWLSFLYLQPININYKAARAYSPLSTVSATPPTKYFSSMLDVEDIETHPLSPASPPWPQRRG